MFDEFVASLKDRLNQPLPGDEAQMKMASTFRRARLMEDIDRRKVRLGSVLISLYLDKGEIHTVLMKRPSYKGVHSGQVSFPGGKKEEEDDDLIMTALREAHEEVGIIPEKVNIIGALSELYIPPSNFLVLPVMGYMKEKPKLVPDPQEVEAILEVPFKHFFQEASLKEGDIPVGNGYKIRAPYFDVEGHVVWGATAMILNEMMEIVTEIEQQNKFGILK